MVSENDNINEEMLLWETEFYAVCQVTGEIRKYMGMLIEATSVQNAVSKMRKMQLDYLQLTGNWYKQGYFSNKEDNITDEMYASISHPMNIVGDMNYDEFIEWLDISDDKEDLIATKKAFEGIPELEEHVKIIDTHIKLKYGDKNEDKEERKTGS